MDSIIIKTYPTPGTVSIPMPDGFDGDLDRLWVGIPVEGLE